MATAIELAMQEAARKREETRKREEELSRQSQMHTTLAQWSSDDHVHSDPPLPPAPAAVAPPAPEPAPQPPAQPEEEMTKPQVKPEPVQENVVSNAAPQTKFKLPTPAEMGVSEACQQAARDNPGALRIDLSRALASVGYNASSVSALFGMMHTQGIIKCDREGHVWARFKKYHKIAHGEAAKKYLPVRRVHAARPARKGVNIDAVHGNIGIHSAKYANAVRWAREKGRPIPTWAEWAKANIPNGLAKRGKLPAPNAVPPSGLTKKGVPDKRKRPEQVRNIQLVHSKAIKKPVDKPVDKRVENAREKAAQALFKPQVASNDVSGILENLTLRQARALYTELRKYFE